MNGGLGKRNYYYIFERDEINNRVRIRTTISGLVPFLLPYSHGWSSVAAILVLSAYQSASVQCPLFDYIGIFFLLLYEKIRCVCPLWVVWGIIAVAAADPVLLYVRTEEVEEEILAQ